MQLENILDKIFFIKIGDDKSYECETFIGIPLNWTVNITILVPFILNGAMNIIQIVVVMLVWWYFVNQAYWYFRVNNKPKDNKSSNTDKAKVVVQSQK